MDTDRWDGFRSRWKEGQGKCGFFCLPEAAYKDHAFDEVLFDSFLQVSFQYFFHGKIIIT